jgi:hypothetical protein
MLVHLVATAQTALPANIAVPLRPGFGYVPVKPPPAAPVGDPPPPPLLLVPPVGVELSGFDPTACRSVELTESVLLVLPWKIVGMA